MSFEAENHLIALVARGRIKAGESGVIPEDFTIPDLKTAWSAALSVEAAGDRATMMTVSSWLNKHGVKPSSSMDWLSRLGVIAESHLYFGSQDEAIRLVKEATKRRQIIKIGTALASNPDDLEGILQELIILRTPEGKGKSVTLKQAQRKALTLIEEYVEASANGGLLGVDTGLPDINEFLAGYHKTDFIVVGGRPAMGKTAFSYTSARAAAKKHTVGFFSSEMADVQLALRSISGESGVSMTDIRKGRISEADWSKIASAVHGMNQSGMNERILINDSAIDIDSLKNQARAWANSTEDGLSGGIIVDYIQNIRVNSKREMSKTEQVMRVSYELKSLAKELGTHVIGLSQVNRDVDSRADKRPGNADCLWASQIEQDADIMMFIYRHETYDRECSQDIKGMAEINITKNRHGEIGETYHVFRGKNVDFVAADISAISSYQSALSDQFQKKATPSGGRRAF